ncbi:MAG: hypothetical protein DRQ49_16910 [Gammaproteobacteria bacterium]|nr:MAG: hypothetical protein DRQ49_16910 [Gammaproteobacteria bacterium]RKZ71392.1 MAG: hypothetical protein DRQ57_18755 [Gammaproteobacteria bacterium]
MSKDSILVIALWFILSAVAIFLWSMTTADSESVIFYTYYLSLVQVITSAGAAFLCYRTMMIFNVNDKARSAWGFLSIGFLFWSAGAILRGSHFRFNLANCFWIHCLRRNDGSCYLYC